MSEAIIGNELDNERGLASVTTGPFPGDQAGQMPHDYPEQNEERRPFDGGVTGTSYLSDILDAQQQLISAQHLYLHDNDPAKLLRAQLHVIGVYNGVLDRLGVFG